MPDTHKDRDTATPPPTETVAVALAYNPESDNAPRILATGRGGIAEQILEVARARGIQVREDADLAEVLRVVELGSEIPVAAFAAVAEILIYLYRANGESSGAVTKTDAATAEQASCP